MPTLMISLDKKILDPASAVAKRMIGYGKKEPLAIVIPTREHVSIRLSQYVTAYGSGGSNRFSQYLAAYRQAKALLFKHKYEKMTVQDPFFTGLIGIVLKNFVKINLEVQLHGDFFSTSYYRSGSIANRIRYLLARFVILPRADKYRVVGERIKLSLIALGISQEKITVLPIAVDTALIKTYVPEFNVHDRYPKYKKIFLVLGRLDPVKNIAWLINLFAKISSIDSQDLLLIVGSGSELENLHKIVSKLNLEASVKFEAWTKHPLSYLKTADALLFPSLSEGYSLVVVEAAAAGTPVIMSDVGVANFEVKSSEKVQIISIDEPDRWIEAIKKI